MRCSLRLLVALVAPLCAAAAPAGAGVADGPTQTYWWCEMHHAPQNIPNVKHKPSALVTALANSPDVVDASKATDADLRTKVVSYSGPGPASKLANNDPIPPQTFWCEMHQGAQANLESRSDAAELSKLSTETLVARVIEAERKAATYQEKVQQIQSLLK